MKPIACTMIVALAACRSASVSPAPVPGQIPVDVVVSSSAFPDGSVIPVDYTCDGANRSPPLTWTWMPESTQSIALLVDDANTDFTHWLVYDIDPKTKLLTPGAIAGHQATNDYDHAGYSGPCPPRGEGHTYRFVILGLDTRLPLKPGDKRDAFDKLTDLHVVARGRLLGTYARP
jgi:Raf kinase inhibitor-like YbhB/YbcL family protein